MTGYVAAQFSRTATTLILARYFLEPEAFGVVGLVTIFLSGLSMFSELGIVTNIVQHPRGDDPAFLDTAFSIQAIRGCVTWLAAILAAYPLAEFYEQPQLFPLLAVGGSSQLIRGLTSTGAWTLTRHVNLRDITLLSIASEAGAASLCIAWAVVSPSPWALVVKIVSSAAIYAIGSHFVAPRRTSFRWDSSAAREVVRFGGWIFISTAVHFLAGQGERLILGKFVTPQELGCFSLAVVIASAPGAGIGVLVTQVFFPMLAITVRVGRSATIRDYTRIRHVFAGVAVLTGMGFLLCGRPMAALLGPRFLMTGWIVQILGLRAALDLFGAPISTLILAHGQSKYSAYFNGARVLLMVSGTLAGYKYFGMRGAVIAIVLSQCLSYFVLITGLGRVLPEVVRSELRWYIALVIALAVAFWTSGGASEAGS